MLNWFARKKSESPLPSPDWSDKKLFETLGAQSGGPSIWKRIQNSTEILREMAQQALLVKYQRKTAQVSLWVGVATVITGGAAIVISIWLPMYQRSQQTQSELSALYRAIDANGDIFVNNYDNMRFFAVSDTIANLPDAYIDYAIPDDLVQPLQQQLGMVNYTWLLYYIDETKFMNQVRDDLNTSLVTNGSTSPEYINAKKIYMATMHYLGYGDKYDQTKFNYAVDTGCLQYLLQQAFSSIPISKFDKTESCSSDSLNRILYWFGYLPPLTPSWMFPLLKDALNERQPGLGDQLIQTNAQY